MNSSTEPRLATVPASGLGMEGVAELLQAAYSGYPVTLRLGPTVLEEWVAVLSLDLEASLVAVRGDSPVAVALVARRGARERLAAFGVVARERRRGTGSWLGRRWVEGARMRGASLLELEVLADNDGAIQLYRGLGFIEREVLLGYAAHPQTAPGDSDGAECVTGVGMAEVAAAVERDGGEQLPWQVSPETLKSLGAPARGFELDGAYVALTESEQSGVRLLALAEPVGASRSGAAERLVNHLFQLFEFKPWSVPALFPSEFHRTRFESLGFQRCEPSQFYMTQQIESSP